MFGWVKPRIGQNLANQTACENRETPGFSLGRFIPVFRLGENAVLYYMLFRKSNRFPVRGWKYRGRRRAGGAAILLDSFRMPFGAGDKPLEYPCWGTPHGLVFLGVQFWGAI